MICRICGENLEAPSLVYGNMVRDVTKLCKEPQKIDGVSQVPIYHCKKCGHYQIPFFEVEDHYYLMSAGKSDKLMALEEEELQLISSVVSKKIRLLEIGCGDGTFLKRANRYFKQCYGLEPSKSYLSICKSKGLMVKKAYLDSRYRSEYTYNAVVARQVFEHIDNPQEVFIAMSALLEEDGVLFLEIPNGGKSIRDGRYFDFFCDHVNYYTTASLFFLANENSMDVLCVREAFGGDYLQLLCKKKKQNLPDIEACMSKDAHRLAAIINMHDKVAIYGAGAKAQAIFMQFSGLLQQVVKVFDTDPLKAGRYIANSHVPIEEPNMSVNETDAVIIFAKSYADEITEMLKKKFDYQGRIYVI